jgi:hypothetical protein
VHYGQIKRAGEFIEFQENKGSYLDNFDQYLFNNATETKIIDLSTLDSSIPVAVIAG